jgi:hypothetical protein
MDSTSREIQVNSLALQITSLRVLRGPNQWAAFPVLEARVDLGQLEDFPSNTLPGFNDRIIAWLPSMIEHRCSIGERGGFFERLRTGTWMGHVLEHVTIELQALGGSPVGYGRAREANARGVYNVVIEYNEETFAIECLHTAHRLIQAAIDDTPFDIAAEAKRLQKMLLDVQLGPSTRSIVEAAAARGIPARRLTEGSLVRLGQGAKQRRIIAAETDRTGAVAESIAQDKELTRTLLAEAGIPVPEGRPVSDAADAWSYDIRAGIARRAGIGLRLEADRRSEWGRSDQFDRQGTRPRSEVAIPVDSLRRDGVPAWRERRGRIDSEPPGAIHHRCCSDLGLAVEKVDRGGAAASCSGKRRCRDARTVVGRRPAAVAGRGKVGLAGSERPDQGRHHGAGFQGFGSESRRRGARCGMRGTNSPTNRELLKEAHWVTPMRVQTPLSLCLLSYR